ncbi:hypothetical protein K1T71_012423 [Dendrolimus kikuchii]|uniref:Uncharacterized protein n=1 Tax=Dendrolimus kikuchii TaxID=765133 RepID=A0ACC1CJB3_9NEOP|nr:hypothetical protein K1T71_012423 [Dendrolimus kikuchii]
MSSEETEVHSLRRKSRMNMNSTTMYMGVTTGVLGDASHEKPYQRVVYQITKKGKHLYEPVSSVPSPFILLLLGFYCLLGYLTQLVEDGMPRVIKDADIPRDNSDTFSEESAWKYMDVILGNEPRVAGTRYHLNKTVDMKALVDGIAVGANREVLTDWQLVTGQWPWSYYSDYFLNSGAPFLNYYQNVSNIIAVLVGESGFHPNGTIGSSVLLNCHYDSVPYAMGASDNVVFCAIMAETLSKLSRRRERLKNNNIFLFNGAEENPLQASHAFLQHPWSKGVTAVVNLDAAGMNGKSTIFQVTDPRVLAAYRRVVRIPNAQGMGEFLFSSGLIPSDTDFRIFRDFGNIHGIDIAFVKWGHVYHTRYDHPDLIREGVIQCSGDMLLGLTTELGNMEELAQRATPTAAVYYDYLNIVLISYSLPASYAVDFGIALFGMCTVSYYVWLVGPRWSTIRELLLALVGRLLSLVAGLAAVAIFVPLMVATTVQMRYLAHPWLVVPLYWVPYLMTAVIVSQLYDDWRTRKSGLNRSIRALQGLAATRLTLASVLVLLLCMPSLVTARYPFSAVLFLTSLTSLLSLTAVRYVRLQGWQHLLFEVLLSLPSAMFAMSVSLRLDAMMLPIMGRAASATPDYTVAMINAGLVAFTACTVSGIELLFSRKRIWLAAVPVGVTCIVLMFVPFSPYQDEGPSTQRHHWFHTQIITQDFNNQTISSTSGLLVTKLDPYSTERVLPALREKGINYDVRTDFTEDCAKYVYCNLPLFRSSFARHLPKALFLYTGPPAPFTPAPSVQLTSKSCVNQLCNYNFSVIGAPHNTITLWPREGVAVSWWSFSSALSRSFVQGNRPVYVVAHSTATHSPVAPPLDFTLALDIPVALQGGPVLDVSHHAHKIHHPEDYTNEYRIILDAMPKYFHVSSFLTFRYNYVF